jgi:hypothetical protein
MGGYYTGESPRAISDGIGLKRRDHSICNFISQFLFATRLTSVADVYYFCEPAGWANLLSSRRALIVKLGRMSRPTPTCRNRAGWEGTTEGRRFYRKL